jgi:class 3 adenylate cyclase
LGLPKNGKAPWVASLVKDCLEEAVRQVRSIEAELDMATHPLLNHTGDGFVLVLRGHDSPIAGAVFACDYAKTTTDRIASYSEDVAAADLDSGLPPLDFGIGMHCGLVSLFDYLGFRDTEGDETKTGFLGTAVNITARVEQCTKDHNHRVLCTSKFREKLQYRLRKAGRAAPPECFGCIGKHRLRGIGNMRTLYWLKPGAAAALRRCCRDRSA